MATIKDVAQESGFSIKTVSRVMTGKGYAKTETRARVMQVARKLGYVLNRPASSLVTGHTMIIGLVVPDISFEFYPEIVWSAEITARQMGYNTILCNTAADPEQERKALNYLRESRVDGVVVLSPRLPENELLLALSQHPAVVSINRPIPSELGGNVCSDHSKGIIEAANHLIKSDRKVIAHMAGPAGLFAADARLSGFLLAMRNAGRPVNPGLIVDYRQNMESGLQALPDMMRSPDVGSSAWRAARNSIGMRGALRLLNLYPETDGIICFDDQLAFGALQACNEAGRKVPEDVAIVGCNDIPLASQTSPRLTTQRVPTFQMGTAAVQRLIERINGKPQQADIVFPHELVIRESAPV